MQIMYGWCAENIDVIVFEKINIIFCFAMVYIEVSIRSIDFFKLAYIYLIGRVNHLLLVNSFALNLITLLFKEPIFSIFLSNEFILLYYIHSSGQWSAAITIEFLVFRHMFNPSIHSFLISTI